MLNNLYSPTLSLCPAPQVWDQRASITGIMFLCVCLVGAAGYKQAPLAEVIESTSGKEGGGDGSSGSGDKNGNGKKRGKGVMYVVLLVAAGATVGLFVKQNASSLPPAPAPLVPPSAAPYVPEPLPQKAHAHGGAHGGAGAGLRHNHTKADGKPHAGHSAHSAGHSVSKAKGHTAKPKPMKKKTD